MFRMILKPGRRLWIGHQRQSTLSRLRAEGGRLLALVAVGGGIVLPLLGIAVALWPDGARAAEVYCGSHADAGSQGGIDCRNSIDVWTDPGCFGTRKVGYDFWGESSSVIDYHFIDFARAWVCGAQAMNAQDLYAYNTDVSNIWSGYSPPNTCGFQADQQIQFFESGVVNDWTYTNW